MRNTGKTGAAGVRPGRLTGAFLTAFMIVGLAASPGTAQAREHQPASTRASARTAHADYLNTDVLFIHGYAFSGPSNCNKSFGLMKKYFRKMGWKNSKLHTWGYYKGDTQCDGKSNYSTNTSIAKVARALAKYIYNNYTRKNKPVSIVAHSMGGLVARRAVIGYRDGEPGYNGKKLDVDNLVTLGTPNAGLQHPCYPTLCTKQWRQMEADSPFQKWMKKKNDFYEQTLGEQLTFVGSAFDGVVGPFKSTINRRADVDVIFDYREHITHSGLRKKGAGKGYDYAHRKGLYGGKWRNTRNGAGPIRMAYLATRYDTW